MNVPENLRYSKEHEWVLIEDGIAKIGITDFAQSELGDIVFIEIDSEGETVPADEVFGTIEAVKTVSDLFMPASGEVMEINPRLESEPELVNTDPYGDGWLIKAKLENNADIENLMDAKAYKDMING